MPQNNQKLLIPIDIYRLNKAKEQKYRKNAQFKKIQYNWATIHLKEIKLDRFKNTYFTRKQIRYT